MSSNTRAPSLRTQRADSRTLVKRIFEAEVPEKYIREIPAQSLYVAIKKQGLLCSEELIQMASLEQCRLLADLDCWKKDRFSEDHFWDWLELPDEQSNLAILQKFINFIDLKLIALIICRYVAVETFEEPTDQPPGTGYSSPDLGHTWVLIALEDKRKHFLLGRLLALIFETNAEAFYQLLSIPNVATPSDIEEQSYNEKSMRLAAEGIPDSDFAHETNAPISEAEVKILLESTEQHQFIEDVRAVLPFTYETLSIGQLAKLLAEGNATEHLENEITLITNAAIVHWDVEIFEYENMIDIIAKVKGAINIGLEIALQLADLNVLEAYRALGLPKLYRVGLGRILAIRNLAKTVSDATLQDVTRDSVELAILANLREPFPVMPQFFRPDGSFEEIDGKLVGDTKAIEKLEEAESLMSFVRKQLM
ncbi:DUF6178 family protein [Oligoflexia bacterium]|nr:DUF6178 family protein [Oligoflexia bacterium]